MCAATRISSFEPLLLTVCAYMLHTLSTSADLEGAALEASLKMRCELSGAGYAIYWKEVPIEGLKPLTSSSMGSRGSN